MTEKSNDKLLLIEKVLILKSLDIFKDTPENVLAEVALLIEEVEIEEGVVIFEEGTIGDCMYVIHQGEVRLEKGNKILTYLKAKEVFGELSLLDAETRSATVITQTDCFLFKIDQEPFYDLMENRAEVMRGIIKMLCKRLRAQNEKIFSSNS